MKHVHISELIFLGFTLFLTLLTAVQSILLYEDYVIPDDTLSSSLTVVALVSAATTLYIYSGFGVAGLHLARKCKLPELVATGTSILRWLVFPAATGAALAGGLIVGDDLVNTVTPLTRIPQPSLPISLIGAATSAMAEEIILRLFALPFLIWLIGFVILRQRHQRLAFAIAAIVVTFLFTVAHTPSFIILSRLAEIQDIPYPLVVVIMAYNALFSLFSLFFFRKYGFLSVLTAHFAADVVWILYYL